jgi:hypothetical protein
VKIHDKSFASVGPVSAYLDWARSGVSQTEVKVRLLTTLRPYFENPSVLADLPITVLGFEAGFINEIKSDAWAMSLLASILSEYRSAFGQNQQRSLDALTAWDEPIARASSEFYSLYLLEVDKKELELDEFRLEVFRNVGGLLEACVQPHLRALLHQVLVRQSRAGDRASLESLKFGSVVEELSRALVMPELIAPPPWNLKVHIVRNIAQHHSASIKSGRIVCTYRTGRQSHQIEFTREDLLALARRLQRVLGVMRAARTVFYLDNEAEIQAKSTAEPRLDVSFFYFSVGIATQGFKIVAINISDGCAHLQVQDVTGGDALSRGVHASQFLVELWAQCRTPNVRMTYIDRSGEFRLAAEARGSDCEDIAEGRAPFEALASRVKFRSHRQV